MCINKIIIYIYFKTEVISFICSMFSVLSRFENLRSEAIVHVPAAVLYGTCYVSYPWEFA